MCLAIDHISPVGGDAGDIYIGLRKQHEKKGGDVCAVLPSCTKAGTFCTIFVNHARTCWGGKISPNYSVQVIGVTCTFALEKVAIWVASSIQNTNLWLFPLAFNTVMDITTEV